MARVRWAAHGACPEISAFVPADFEQRRVIFIDLKPFKAALYPKSRQGILKHCSGSTFNLKQLNVDRNRLTLSASFPARRIHNILASKEVSFSETFHTLFGDHLPVPKINHSADGKRQAECWDDYVIDSDKAFLKNAHGTHHFVLSFLVSDMTRESTCVATQERKYESALVFRDLVNMVMDRNKGRAIGLPFQGSVLPISHGKLLQTKDALRGISPTAGQQVLDWWNAVVAEDITIPGSTRLLNNTET